MMPGKRLIRFWKGACLIPFESMVAIHQWRCSYYMYPTLSSDWKIDFSVSCRPLDPFDDAWEPLDPFRERCWGVKNLPKAADS